MLSTYCRFKSYAKYRMQLQIKTILDEFLSTKTLDTCHLIYSELITKRKKKRSLVLRYLESLKADVALKKSYDETKVFRLTWVLCSWQPWLVNHH